MSVERHLMEVAIECAKKAESETAYFRDELRKAHNRALNFEAQLHNIRRAANRVPCGNEAPVCDFDAAQPCELKDEPPWAPCEPLPEKTHPR